MKRAVFGICFLLVSVYGICYYTSRTQFELQFLFWSAGFIGYALLCFSKCGKSLWKILLVLAIVIRIFAAFSFPTLSDDIYRFLWDGSLITKGVNPYAHTPAEYRGFEEHDTEIYQMINSQEYHSIYPPINQFVFFLAARLFENHYKQALLIKFVLVLAEAILLFFMISHLSFSGHSKERVFLYAFNPLVIIEISGNAHFEGLALLGILAFIYWLQKKQILKASLCFAFGVWVKLNPLLFLPICIAHIKKPKKLLLFLLTFSLISFVFIKIIDLQYLPGISKSLKLYFNDFEFNGGIYYLLRATGVWFFGYNPINVLGPCLACFSVLLILGLGAYYWKMSPDKLASYFFKAYLIFLLLNQVVHPWYLIPLIGLSLFTGWRFPILWSYLIFLSYSAYAELPYRENLVLISIEYILLGAFILLEFIIPKWKRSLSLVGE